MGWELDHVFYATDERGHWERALLAAGLGLAAPRTHAGQGTENTCAFFERGYVELLYARDRAELASDTVAPLGLNERIHARDSGACPLGLCFRPTGPDGERASWPFAVWDYAPAYMPVGATIPMVTPARSLAEPLVFIAVWPPRARPPGPPLTRVEVRLPRAVSPSPGVRHFLAQAPVSTRIAEAYALALEWTGGAIVLGPAALAG